MNKIESLKQGMGRDDGAEEEPRLLYSTVLGIFYFWMLFVGPVGVPDGAAATIINTTMYSTYGGVYNLHICWKQTRYKLSFYLNSEYCNF